MRKTSAQRQELQAWAERAGHKVVKVYEDQGISGAKGRDKRPAFDALLKAAVRRENDMIAVWSSDRLGRSLQHLVEVLETIRDTGTGLYIHTQAVDTTTPAGRAMFGMLGVFAEFEREMIHARVVAPTPFRVCMTSCRLSTACAPATSLPSPRTSHTRPRRRRSWRRALDPHPAAVR